MGNIIDTISDVKTEWIAFLLVFGAIVANRLIDLGLTLEDIITLASLAGVYAGGRSAAKALEGRK